MAKKDPAPQIEWYEERKTPTGWPVNPAIDAVLHSPKYGKILRSIAHEAKALFEQRARRRTGRYAASGKVHRDLLRTSDSDPGRWAGVLTIRAPYSAAVEFGQVNLARDNERSRGRRRVLPGSMPDRWAGDHTLGGDNRRLRSVVADIERRHGRFR